MKLIELEVRSSAKVEGHFERSLEAFRPSPTASTSTCRLCGHRGLCHHCGPFPQTLPLLLQDLKPFQLMLIRSLRLQELRPVVLEAQLIKWKPSWWRYGTAGLRDSIFLIIGNAVDA